MKRLLRMFIFCLVCLNANANEADIYSGKIVLVDRHANTITIETATGLREFEVDSRDIIIEESGPIVGYEQDPSLKSLMLGDIVTVFEAEQTQLPERQKLKRIQRLRPQP